MYKGAFTNHFYERHYDVKGGGGSEGVTLTNCSCTEVEPSVFFFYTRRGLAIARENVGRRPQVLLHPKHYAEVLATEGNS